MTPRHGDPDPAARRKHFGAVLDRAMTERRMRNADLARALGGAYDRSMVSQWRGGKALPGELAVMKIADALHVKETDLLREAGYDEMAARVRPAPRDPVFDLLDAIGDPELTGPLAAEYERDMAIARRRIELELAELRRRIAAQTQQEPPAEGVI